MSLLSGIRYVSKEERGIINLSDSDKKDKKEKKEKKKTKKESKDKKRSHISKKDKRKQISSESESDSSEEERIFSRGRKNSESSADSYSESLHASKKYRKHQSENSNEDSVSKMSEYLLKEFEQEIIEEKNQEKETKRFDDLKNISSLDTDRFKSLLSHLKSSSKPVDISNSIQSFPVDENISEPTNYSIAEKLRMKLKGSIPTSLKPKLPNLTQETHLPAKDKINEIINDYDIRKEIMLLQSNYSKTNKDSKVKDKSKIKHIFSEPEPPHFQDSKSIKDDILQMIKEEKNSNNNNNDVDKLYSANVLKMGTKFTEKDDIYSTLGSDSAGKDEDSSIVSKALRKSNSTATMKDGLNGLIKKHDKINSIREKCSMCFQNYYFPKNLIIFKSEYVILRLKDSRFSITEGHCEIIPTQHVSSLNKCNEETENEIQQILSLLRGYFATLSIPKNIVCFESALSVNNDFQHTHLDIVPFSSGAESEIQMSFKQAFLSCDEEWSQHKKIVELSDQKPLKYALPNNFSYLMAMWYDELPISIRSDFTKGRRGYVHPVENDSIIDPSICYDVMASFYEEDTLNLRNKLLSGRKSKTNDEISQENLKVEQFKNTWTSFISTL